jgi:hypothetical protein
MVKALNHRSAFLWFFDFDFLTQIPFFDLKSWYRKHHIVPETKSKCDCRLVMIKRSNYLQEREVTVYWDRQVIAMVINWWFDMADGKDIACPPSWLLGSKSWYNFGFGFHKTEQYCSCNSSALLCRRWARLQTDWLIDLYIHGLVLKCITITPLQGIEQPAMWMWWAL